MELLLKSPFFFKRRKYRSFLDISTAYRPHSVEESEYLKVLQQAFKQQPKSEAQFIEALKPDKGWIFFCGKLFNGPKDIVKYYEMPESDLDTVSELLRAQDINSEASLIMHIQQLKSSRIKNALYTVQNDCPVAVLGENHSSVLALISEFKFLSGVLDGSPLELESRLLARFNSYFFVKPIKLGFVLLYSLEEVVEYTKQKPLAVVRKLYSVKPTSALEPLFWPGVTGSDGPIIVGGEMFAKSRLALRAYAIDWQMFLAKVNGIHGASFKDVQALFSDDALLGTDPASLFSYAGKEFSLVEFMGVIGGHANIFLSRVESSTPNFDKKSMQEIIDGFLLGKGRSVQYKG